MRGRVASVMKAMGDPHRLDILYMLRRNEARVKDLVDALGSSQANISKHLAVLRQAGLIDFRQDGVSRYYYIADAAVFSICDAVCDSVERHFEAERSMFGNPPK
jgi:ArsR family transcriptional regulator